LADVAAVRGNAAVGQDVMKQARSVRGVPNGL
jgi:hypothetical protein